MTYANTYTEALFSDILPFWERYSIDKVDGGYFTCLNRDGSVYGTDKFQWLQLRQIWTFAMLYNRHEHHVNWLRIAESGAQFQLKNGRNEVGDWYFALDKKGSPLVQPYNVFTDAFASMAFAQLYQSSGKAIYADVAKQTFDRILERQDNPKGIYNKKYPGTRDLQNFALPMILCNLCLELEDVVDVALVESTIDKCLDLVLRDFYDEETGLVLENIHTDGSLLNCFDGRLLNPGHAIEAMWFVMDLATRRNDKKIMETAKNRMLFMLEFGWDEEHGGIFYFLDRLAVPMQQLEWDQKLWWVHLETLVALLKAYQFTGDEHCWNWFVKVHDYTWQHFPDPENGEWFGYLRRDGSILSEQKGGKWKGCFHVPRALFYCSQVLVELGK